MSRLNFVKEILKIFIWGKIHVSYAFMSTPPPVGWGLTYCFTAVGVGVLVGVTPITKGPPAQIFFGRHVFCSPGH